ncbi:MAG: NFACT family protein, partial [Clostridia bacterium]|nr:NFACT family protein [Clostridia bacterium]
GKPKDYSYMDITYLGDSLKKQSFDTLGELFDLYFAERDRIEKTRQRAKDILTLLSNTKARTERKLAIQREALAESEHGDIYRRRADLITANLYKIKRGDTLLRTEDFYEEGAPVVEIELDKRLSPSANAQRMYKLYNKAKNAKAVLTEQIALWERELVYLDSVSSFLERAATEADIAEIREELYASGYAARMRGYKPHKQQKLQPTVAYTESGLKMIIGKNNTQNDLVTFKLAKKDDIWFHVKDAPGSHVVLVSEGEEPSERDYTEAAELAAAYSSLSASPTVAVDYTRVKNVKKPPHAKPGYVIYKTNYTAYVKPKEL